MNTLNIVLLLNAISLLMMVVGFIVLRSGWRKNRSERVAERLKNGYQDKLAVKRNIDPVQRLLLRAGLDIPLGFIGVCVVLGLLLISMAYGRGGIWAAFLVLAGMLCAGYGWFRWRYQRRLQKMVDQVPAFLDHMIRSLKSGRTVGDAMLLAIERCHEPLRSAFSGVQRSMELGVAPSEAMEDFALIYDRQEFHILAMGLRVNHRHGGNASELLDSLIAMIRDRERAQRQLRALTGETRISALVLAVLPIVLAGYIFISNPAFLLGLWNSSTGQYLLLSALGLQLLGCFLLWRMLRSI